jgi:hypothetical protein
MGPKASRSRDPGGSRPLLEREAADRLGMAQVWRCVRHSAAASVTRPYEWEIDGIGIQNSYVRHLLTWSVTDLHRVPCFVEATVS